MKLLILVVSLGGLLIAAVAAAIYLWLSLGAAEMSVHGMIAMSLGTALSFALGAGLMFLVFYSSRRGHDDDASGR